MTRWRRCLVHKSTPHFLPGDLSGAVTALCSRFYSSLVDYWMGSRARLGRSDFPLPVVREFTPSVSGAPHADWELCHCGLRVQESSSVEKKEIMTQTIPRKTERGQTIEFLVCSTLILLGHSTFFKILTHVVVILSSTPGLVLPLQGTAFLCHLSPPLATIILPLVYKPTHNLPQLAFVLASPRCLINFAFHLPWSLHPKHM